MNILDLKRTAVLLCENADIQNNTLLTNSPLPLPPFTQIFKYTCSGTKEQNKPLFYTSYPQNQNPRLIFKTIQPHSNLITGHILKEYIYRFYCMESDTFPPTSETTVMHQEDDLFTPKQCLQQ